MNEQEKREYYERLIEKAGLLKTTSEMEEIDLGIEYMCAFLEGSDDINKRILNFYCAYRFGLLQALRYSLNHSPEEVAAIVRKAEEEAAKE